eukprot:m.23723 g.23723  ORF g.23723 m.23723 type:complete len:85 (-) comp3931_c0_seq1:202-456(-)
MEYLGTRVRLVLVDNTEADGLVYAVDPLSNTITLRSTAHAEQPYFRIIAISFVQACHILAPASETHEALELPPLSIDDIRRKLQ